MGFFAPWFLAGIAAVALPIWIHLLRQHKSVPKPFSSLMFFERRTQSSVKHRRLRFYALLALRLAMLLLLALLFANPFINRKASAASGKKLVLIAVDRSFSMRYGNHLDKAKEQALAAIPNGQKTQIVGVSNRVELLTEPLLDHTALVNAVQAIKPGDGASSYGEFARFVRGLPKSIGMPVEAHFFSDMQKTGMPPSFSDLALSDNEKLVLHSVADKTSANWTVESVTAPARVFSGKKDRVQATIAGFETPASRKTVSLLLNGKLVESKSVDVPEHGRAQVEFLSLDAPYGANRGEVRIEGSDSLKADDAYYFSVERTDPAKILFIHDSRQTPLYFRTALESGAENAFEMEAVSPDQAVTLPLDKYAFAVLSGTGEIPDALESRLKDYVSSGRGLLVALGPSSLMQGRVPVTGDKVSESRYSAREGDRFQTATDIDHSHPALQKTDFAAVRFYQTMRVDEANGRVLARLSDKTPLLLDRKVGEGRVLVFTSTFDNVSNDLPLHAAFVPFVEEAAHYLEGGEARRSSTSVGSFVDLRTSHDRGAAAEVLDPDGKRALSLSESTTAKTFQFDREGFFDVRPANGRRQLVAVNADRRESDLTPVPDETLALWQGTPGRAPGDNNGSLGGEETPVSFWKYLLAALLVIAAAESIVADRFTPAATDEKREVRKKAA
jgi:aerotolerance regulator-like protein